MYALIVYSSAAAAHRHVDAAQVVLDVADDCHHVARIPPARHCAAAGPGARISTSVQNETKGTEEGESGGCFISFSRTSIRGRERTLSLMQRQGHRGRKEREGGEEMKYATFAEMERKNERAREI
jgi:hypothetical protein